MPLPTRARRGAFTATLLAIVPIAGVASLLGAGGAGVPAARSGLEEQAARATPADRPEVDVCTLGDAASPRLRAVPRRTVLHVARQLDDRRSRPCAATEAERVAVAGSELACRAGDAEVSVVEIRWGGR